MTVSLVWLHPLPATKEAKGIKHPVLFHPVPSITNPLQLVPVQEAQADPTEWKQIGRKLEHMDVAQDRHTEPHRTGMDASSSCMAWEQEMGKNVLPTKARHRRYTPLETGSE